MIVVNAYGIFSGMSRKKFHQTLLTPVHVFARVNQKAIITEGFNHNLSKVKKKNSPDKNIIN